MLFVLLLPGACSESSTPDQPSPEPSDSVETESNPTSQQIVVEQNGDPYLIQMDGEEIDGVFHFKMDWDMLGNVEFAPYGKGGEESALPVAQPSKILEQLNGQPVYLSGFLIPLEPEIGVYALSKNPNASCFFCGAAGPETVAKITVENATPEMVMDAHLAFKGQFVFNTSDPYELAFVINGASQR